MRLHVGIDGSPGPAQSRKGLPRGRLHSTYTRLEQHPPIVEEILSAFDWRTDAPARKLSVEPQLQGSYGVDHRGVIVAVMPCRPE
jgi:hypothetical protein